MVQELIAQNARVAQNQDDYNAAYDTAVSCYEATKAEREKVAADIRQRGIRRREFERFTTELEKLPEEVSEFDETLWGSLVDYVTWARIRRWCSRCLVGLKPLPEQIISGRR